VTKTWITGVRYPAGADSLIFDSIQPGLCRHGDRSHMSSWSGNFSILLHTTLQICIIFLNRRELIKHFMYTVCICFVISAIVTLYYRTRKVCPVLNYLSTALWMSGLEVEGYNNSFLTVSPRWRSRVLYQQVNIEGGQLNTEPRRTARLTALYFL
jgi:hypothetical protein